jgi:hypothetical protein
LARYPDLYGVVAVQETRRAHPHLLEPGGDRRYGGACGVDLLAVDVEGLGLYSEVAGDTGDGEHRGAPPPAQPADAR